MSPKPVKSLRSAGDARPGRAAVASGGSEVEVAGRGSESEPRHGDVRVDAEGVLGAISDRLRDVLAGLAAEVGEERSEGALGMGEVFPRELAPRDLERMLGLHKTLCWRILQVAYARDRLAAAPHLPGDEGMEKFLRAAGRRGVTSETLDAVRAGVARYRTLTKAHAGDRASFEVMMLGLASPTENAVELKAARRAGFRSASYAWGVQTAVRVLSAIVTPVGDDLVDLATLRAHIRARRVRREGVLRLSRTVEHDTDAPGTGRVRSVAIEPQSVIGGVPVLPDFCTKPLPRLEAVTLADGTVEYRFVDQPLGERAAITVFTGEIRRGVSGARWSGPSGSTNALILTVRDPMGLAVIDLWAPPGFGLAHRALVVNAVGVDPLKQTPAQWHVLPTSTTVERMGRGLEAARVSEAPAYEAAIGHCFDRLGWRPSEYELHRVQLEYPVQGTCLVLQTELREKPGA